MTSDRLVTAQHVLRSVMELRRRGSRRVLSELEAVEPDLAEHLLEGLTGLYHGLLRAGLSGEQARRIHGRAQAVALACLMALRRAHHDLWRDGPGGPADDPPTDDLPPEEPPQEPPGPPPTSPLLPPPT